jgi:hypothetical protein
LNLRSTPVTGRWRFPYDPGAARNTLSTKDLTSKKRYEGYR